MVGSFSFLGYAALRRLSSRFGMRTKSWTHWRSTFSPAHPCLKYGPRESWNIRLQLGVFGFRWKPDRHSPHMADGRKAQWCGFSMCLRLWNGDKFPTEAQNALRKAVGWLLGGPGRRALVVRSFHVASNDSYPKACRRLCLSRFRSQWSLAYRRGGDQRHRVHDVEAFGRMDSVRTI